MNQRIHRTCLALALGAGLACLLWPAPTPAVQKDGDKKVYEVNEKDGLTVGGKLAATDDKDTSLKDSYRKVYLVKMSAGKEYTIRMNAKPGEKIDAVLRVEDPSGKELAFNDDAPGEDTLDSRIDFKCAKDDVYRVICTSLNGNATGDYTLIIKRAAK